MNDPYISYVEYCDRLGVLPCSRAAYEHEIQNVRSDGEGFARFGSSTIALYKQKRHVRRGTFVTIGCLSELLFGARNIEAMKQVLTGINLSGATKTHAVEGENYTLYEVSTIMRRLGKAAIIEHEEEQTQNTFTQPEEEFVALLSNAMLDSIPTPEPDFAEATA